MKALAILSFLKKITVLAGSQALCFRRLTPRPPGWGPNWENSPHRVTCGSVRRLLPGCAKETHPDCLRLRGGKVGVVVETPWKLCASVGKRESQNFQRLGQNPKRMSP